MNKWFISDVYEIDVDNIKYDADICKFNEPKEKENYESLKRQIMKNGQNEPAYLRNGLLGDGVHRAKIAKELGTRLKVVDIDPAIPNNEYLEMCNVNIFTARNNSVTQLAIKAFMFTKDYGYTDAEAKAAIGIKDKKLISIARTIYYSEYNRKHNVIDSLLKGNAVSIGDIYTKSLEVVYRKLRALEDKEVESMFLAEEPVVRYEDYLVSPEAADVFWKDFNLESIPMGTKFKIIQLLNTVYAVRNNS